VKGWDQSRSNGKKRKQKHEPGDGGSRDLIFGKTGGCRMEASEGNTEGGLPQGRGKKKKETFDLSDENAQEKEPKDPSHPKGKGCF